jgi:alkylation response protein AidB-like acyl-CoA dehydrogenase
MRHLLESDTSDASPTLWNNFAELGLLGLVAPEENGGLAQDFSVMAGIAEMAGNVALTEPLIEIAGISVPVLAEMGATDELNAVISGGLKVLPVCGLSGMVSHADKADMFLIGEGGKARLLDKNDVTLTPLKSIDPLRKLYKVSHAGDGLEAIDQRGTILNASFLCGLSKRMVTLSVDYAKDREQFGKQIGSFQAIKHQLANVHTQIEFTRPIVQLAATQNGRCVHQAKVSSIDTAMLAAETAIQVHGGMGYTFEVSLHMFMKRAWALCGEWGDRNHHINILETMILADDAELGPGTTFSY